MTRHISEHKFIIYNIAPLFKYYEYTFGTISFEWVETHDRAAKIAKTKTSSNSGILKLDAKATRLYDNCEVWQLEVAGPPWNPVLSHIVGDTKKSLKTDMFNLIALLRNHLDCGIELATGLKVFSTTVIGKWHFG